MPVFTRHPAARWGVPAAAVAVALGGTGLLSRVAASADQPLPPRSAAQLLVDLQTARLDAGSGTIVQRAALGLPALPSIGGSGSSDLTSLISGNHTLRVWYSGPSRARLALLGTLGESDVIRNGSDAWIWSSDTNSATHYTLPNSSDARTPTPGDLAGRASLTPQQAADAALKAIDPTTRVTTEGSARIAGRSAYELVLAPKDTGSLVGQVRIAIDSARHVPLRVQVVARGATSPAVEIGFTQISFDRPADGQFVFRAPPGTRVKQGTAPMGGPASGQDRRTTGKQPATGKQQATGRQPAKPAPADTSAGEPTTVGTGWTTVVELPAGAQAAATAQGGANASGPARQWIRVLNALPRVSGSWGSGRLLAGTLFSVLLTDDGRVLAGAVTPARLEQVAAAPQASR